MLAECLFLTASLCSWTARQPVRELTLPRFSRPVVLAAGVLAGAQLADGSSTRAAMQNCPSCYEIDPVARTVLGRRPGWGRMIVFGTVENVGAALLAERMRRSRYRPVRVLWPLPQAALIAVHTWGTVHNSAR